MRISLIFILGLCLLVRLAYADKVRIIETTADAAQVRVDLIQQANRSIDAQYYIVGNDYFTLAGLALLCDAARRGCEVRLLIDGRSNKLSAAVHAELKRSGVAVKLYHLFTLVKLGAFLRRMHDKGLTVDRKYMIRGGRNAEGDYFGYWKRNYIDRDVYVEGRAVGQSAAYFNRENGKSL
jgi:cardiolipin synthase C